MARKNNRPQIVSYLNERLDVAGIPDLSSNGLQVEGTKEIRRIGLAVDACLAIFKQAKKKQCQMIITHHGLIWGGIPYVTGTVRNSLFYLLKNNLNLYAAHLPLDLHPELGNNIGLCRILNLIDIKEFGLYKGTAIGFEGRLSSPSSPEKLAERFRRSIGGEPLVLPFGKKKVERVGVVSGRASGELEEAIAKGMDCYVTGESHHEHYHLARESGISVIYLGHYYSEKPGVQAAGEELKKKFGIEAIFLDEPTII